MSSMIEALNEGEMKKNESLITWMNKCWPYTFYYCPIVFSSVIIEDLGTSCSVSWEKTQHKPPFSRAESACQKERVKVSLELCFRNLPWSIPLFMSIPTILELCGSIWWSKTPKRRLERLGIQRDGNRKKKRKRTWKLDL